MHTISSYRGNRPTNKQTPTNTHAHTQTGPITIHYAAASYSAQCNKTRMALSRSHTSAKAADVVKLLLLNTRRVTHMQSMAVPHLTVTATLSQP